MYKRKSSIGLKFMIWYMRRLKRKENAKSIKDDMKIIMSHIVRMEVDYDTEIRHSYSLLNPLSLIENYMPKGYYLEKEGSYTFIKKVLVDD